MAADRYVHVRYPWRATIDLSAPEPARFYLALIAQTLQCGAPASRPGGRAWSRLVRRGIPERSLAELLRRSGTVRREADAPVVPPEVVRAHWEELRTSDPSLPAAPPVSVLEIARNSAVTTFVFGDGPTPLLVVKNARAGQDGVATEVAALQQAAGTGLAPRYLGAVPGLGEVQRGLPGRALDVEPVTARNARDLAWRPEHQALAAGLVRLGRATRSPVRPDTEGSGMVAVALGHPGLSARTRQALREAQEALGQVEIAVLTHTDTSPQNILYADGRLSGLVDWADAYAAGVPGSDVLNAAVAYIELGVGLVRWDDRTLQTAFDAGYLDSDFGRRARLAGGDCAEAAGMPRELWPCLELAFFARRLGWRMSHRDRFPTSAELALRALENVRAAGPVG
jgi:hypothetical protein